MAIKLHLPEMPVVAIALSQLSADPGQEGSQRKWAWKAADALMDDSRWKSLREVARQSMSKATDPTPPRPRELRGRNSCLSLNLKDKFTIHKQKLQNCWIPGEPQECSSSAPSTEEEAEAHCSQRECTAGGPTRSLTQTPGFQAFYHTTLTGS